ncbi:MAG: amidohydrolase family protein [Bacteroidota bacterium]|nr:amidohydrolase family protein [Bacteroidota bacterium]
MNFNSKFNIQHSTFIDTHVHFWHYDSNNPEFDWIGEGKEKIQKSFLPEDLIQNSPEILRDKIQNFSCIAVQAAETWQETEFLLGLAAKHDFIKGVVGWADLTLFNSTFNIQHSTFLKGFRHIIQSKPTGLMSSDHFRYFISKLHNHQYTYDLLLKPHQLSEALDLVQEFPNQKFVIDHLAKPDLRTHDLDKWEHDLSAFKELENVFCKLSGLVTEAYWQNWKHDDFTNVLDVAFETFGTDRLMYGSDWPVCLLAGSYQDVLGIIQTYTSKLSKVDQDKIFYQNALFFYNINI